MTHPRHLLVRQTGFILPVAMIFLVSLTIMAVMGIKTALLQERSAGGERDQTRARQAAERALRIAEIEIYEELSVSDETVMKDCDFCRPVNYRGSGFCKGTPTCEFGLCDSGTDPLSAKPWEDATLTDKRIKAGQYLGMKEESLKTELGVSKVPEYLIETFDLLKDGHKVPFYRVTAWGYGANPNVMVLLQSVISTEAAIMPCAK